MKKILHLITFCSLIILTLDVLGLDPSLISNPSGFKYCDNDSLKLGVQNTVKGKIYNLQINKNGNNWETKASEEATKTGDTVWFKGIWGAGIYRLMVENPQYTSDPQTVLKVNSPKKFNITGGGGYCEGYYAEFEIGLDGSEKNVTYRLYKNGQQTTIQINGTGSSILFGYFGEPGIYTSKGSKSPCEIDMEGSVYITEFPNPIANFYFEYFPGNNYECSSVQFYDSTTNGTPPYTYIWDFGDDETPASTEANPKHIFPAFGIEQQEYNVFLTVIDANGCQDTITKKVTVTERPDASIKGSGSSGGGFANCDPDTLAVFNLTITNASKTSSTNTNYWVDWKGTGDFFDLGAEFVTASHTYETKGSFPLTMMVEGINGCFDTRIYYVFNGSTPKMSMETDELSGCSPFLAKFKMSSNVYQNTPGTTYDFDFGDGNSVSYTQETLPQPDTAGKCVIEHTYWQSSCGLYNNSFVMNCIVENPCRFIPYTVGGINISKAPVAGFVVGGFPPSKPIYLCAGIQYIFSKYMTKIYNSF